MVCAVYRIGFALTGNGGDGLDIDWFKDWLNAEMEKRNMTCYQLAKMTGLSNVTVIYYTRGIRNPSLGAVNVLLNALGKHFEIVDN